MKDDKKVRPEAIEAADKIDDLLERERVAGCSEGRYTLMMAVIDKAIKKAIGEEKANECGEPDPCEDCAHDGEACSMDPESLCVGWAAEAAVPASEPSEAKGPYTGDPATCECDYHRACRGEMLVQPASEPSEIDCHMCRHWDEDPMICNDDPVCVSGSKFEPVQPAPSGENALYELDRVLTSFANPGAWDVNRKFSTSPEDPIKMAHSGLRALAALRAQLAERTRDNLSFEQIERALIDKSGEVKSEYIQVSIILVRDIFEARAALDGKEPSHA